MACRRCRAGCRECRPCQRCKASGRTGGDHCATCGGTGIDQSLHAPHCEHPKKWELVDESYDEKDRHVTTVTCGECGLILSETVSL